MIKISAYFHRPRPGRGAERVPNVGEAPTVRGALESRLRRSWPEKSAVIYIILEI